MGAISLSRCALALSLLLWAGCSRSRTTDSFEFRQSIALDAGARVSVAFHREDASIAAEVFRATEQALPRALRWGALRGPVEVKIHANHDDLETAVGYKDLPWLRAWATQDAVHLQSPRTWGGGDTEERLAELLLHELTHVVMYQRALPPRAPIPAIPVWFSEGMASYTAEQGYRRLPPEQLGAYLREHPRANLLRPSQALYRDRRDLAYSAGHWAFRYLHESHGEDAVHDFLDAMHNGLSFDRAFSRVFGESPQLFEDRLHAILREAF